MTIRARTSSSVVATLAILATLAASMFARTAHAAGGEKAASQVLFDQARALSASGNWGEACPKFEESQRLDATLGTQYFLADCYEHSGRTATAWAMFLEVAERAGSAGELAKQKKARERATSLEPKLSRIAVSVAAGAPPGLVVRRQDVVLGTAQWGLALPVDPGRYRIRASAEGKVDWESTVEVAQPGETTTVLVPVLREAAPTRAAHAAPQPVPASLPPRPPVVAPVEEPHRPSGSSKALSTWTYVGFGTAAAGLVAGSVTGLMAMSKASSLKERCGAGHCQPSEYDSLDAANRLGNFSTVSFAVAGGGLVVGVLSLLVGHGDASGIDLGTAGKGAPLVATRVRPWVGWGVAGVSGAF